MVTRSGINLIRLTVWVSLLLLGVGSYAQTAPASPSLRDLNNWAIQGRYNRTNYVSNFNDLTLGSGHFSVLDETNKPTGQLALWQWHLVRTKQGVDGTNNWLTDIATHWKTGAMYHRLYDGQTSAFTPWKRVHTNNWFPVKEDQTYALGDRIWHDGTEFIRSGNRYKLYNVTTDGATYTLDPKVFETLSLYNVTAGAATVTLNHNNAWFGYRLHIKIYPGNTNGFTIQSTGPAQFEQDNGAFASTYAITASQAVRGVVFEFSPGGNWERVATYVNPAAISGGGGTTDASLLTTGTLPSARLPALTGDATTTAGSAAVTVGRIRGVTVSTTTPANGQVLQYNSTNTQYEPVTVVTQAQVGTSLGVAQLDGNTRLPLAQLPTPATRAVTANYTLVADDCYRTLLINSATAVTVTVPGNVILSGCPVNWVQEGAGQATFTAGASMTINARSGFTKSAGQWAIGTIQLRTSITAVLGGDTSN